MIQQQDGSHTARLDRCRPALVPTVAAILVLLERVLVHELGSPATLVRALGDLGQPWTDPVGSVLGVLALTVEGLVGYALAMLVLGSLSLLPGSMGRLAARLTPLVTPVVARRLLDVLVGGALLGQAALAAAPGVPPGFGRSASHLASSMALPFGGSVTSITFGDPTPTSLGTGWLRWPVDPTGPPGARPNPRRSAAPLPPWLGGGPSNTAAGHDDQGHGPGTPEGDGAGAPEGRDRAGGTAVAEQVVQVGDTLWDIAAARLPPAQRSAANIDRYWRQIYLANRSVIGADPDLLRPGTRLQVPPFGRTRR